MVAVSALVFAVLAFGAAMFQLCLAAGAPWGALALGGKFPGQLPQHMRWVVAFQACVLIALAWIVLEKAGLTSLSGGLAVGWLAWVPVAFSAVSLLLNLATSSERERRLWAPVAGLLLCSSSYVAWA